MMDLRKLSINLKTLNKVIILIKQKGSPYEYNKEDIYWSRTSNISMYCA